MKRYVVTAWDGYYPDSDLNNIRADFDDYEDAHEVADMYREREVYDHVNVHDLHTATVDHRLSQSENEIFSIYYGRKILKALDATELTVGAPHPGDEFSDLLVNLVTGSIKSLVNSPKAIYLVSRSFSRTEIKLDWRVEDLTNDLRNGLVDALRSEDPNDHFLAQESLRYLLVSKDFSPLAVSFQQNNP